MSSFIQHDYFEIYSCCFINSLLLCYPVTFLCMDMPYFIYSAVDGFLDCFEFEATLNKYAQ